MQEREQCVGAGKGRLLLLLACLALGTAIGFVGYWFSGAQDWFLAIPGAVAAGWLFVANPEACQGK